MNDELLALADRLKNAGLNFGDQSDPCSLKVTVPERDTIVSALRLAAQSPEPVAASDGALREALRDMFCPRPCNNRPDDCTVGQCFDAGECGCAARKALAASEATKSDGGGQVAPAKCSAPGARPTGTSCTAEPEVAPGPSDTRPADVTVCPHGFSHPRFCSTCNGY